MSDLIERLEAATGPCRELDAAILTQVMGYRDVYGDGTVFDRGNDGYWYVGEHSAPQLPAPTASIDAALTLVPEGCDWKVDTWKGKPAAMVRVGTRHYQSGYTDNPATPALATCIAALRAKGVINE